MVFTEAEAIKIKHCGLAGLADAETCRRLNLAATNKNIAAVGARRRAYGIYFNRCKNTKSGQHIYRPRYGQGHVAKAVQHANIMMRLDSTKLSLRIALAGGMAMYMKLGK